MQSCFIRPFCFVSTLEILWAWQFLKFLHHGNGHRQYVQTRQQTGTDLKTWITTHRTYYNEQSQQEARVKKGLPWKKMTFLLPVKTTQQATLCQTQQNETLKLSRKCEFPFWYVCIVWGEVGLVLSTWQITQLCFYSRLDKSFPYIIAANFASLS